MLTLIDCAGSERRHDSMYHDSQRQKESAEINASLWAIKVREAFCLRLLRMPSNAPNTKLSLAGVHSG
jgi:kinesin family protein 2/24